MDKLWGLHWFRRDLRMVGNSALRWNWKEAEGRVLGIFCFDPQFLSRSDFSVDRFAFFLTTLVTLRDELRRNGGDLLVLDHGPQKAFPYLLHHLQEKKIPLPKWITWNRDYEPFARKRDSWAKEYFEKQTSIFVHTERDHLIIEPDELSKDGTPGNFYSIYTPFSKKWMTLFNQTSFLERIKEQRKALNNSKKQSRGHLFQLTWERLLGKKSPILDVLEHYLQKCTCLARVKLPEAGHKVAIRKLIEFSSKAEIYHESRDFPSLNGTSCMSIFLKNGSITTSQIAAVLELDEFVLAEGKIKYLKELIWREFYYHILWHRPEVENDTFNPQYRNIAWKNNEDWFEAWKSGMTGYPIVDAGMRELNQTGRMHNRLRMIVASFLTKNLLIDWRWGEQYFMERLLDGDLAPNNGGWQWAASTGCDAQPYFRIFNPELQSRKFDSKGLYLRQFLPELQHLSDNEIHAPSASSILGKYPIPIMDYHEQRVAALNLYKAASVSKLESKK